MAEPFWLWMYAHIILASASTASSKSFDDIYTVYRCIQNVLLWSAFGRHQRNLWMVKVIDWKIKNCNDFWHDHTTLSHSDHLLGTWNAERLQHFIRNQKHFTWHLSTFGFPKLRKFDVSDGTTHQGQRSDPIRHIRGPRLRRGRWRDPTASLVLCKSPRAPGEKSMRFVVCESLSLSNSWVVFVGGMSCGKMVKVDVWWLYDWGLILWSQKDPKGVDKLWVVEIWTVLWHILRCHVFLTFYKKLLLQPQSTQLPNECESQKMWCRNARKSKSSACFPNHWWSWSILVGCSPMSPRKSYVAGVSSETYQDHPRSKDKRFTLRWETQKSQVMLHLQTFMRFWNWHERPHLQNAIVVSNVC